MLLYAIILNVLLLQGVKAKEESALGICGRPIVPSRGPLIVHGNSFLDGDEVQFSCVANYDLFGSQRSRCVGHKWNTRVPECKARCIFGGDLDNGFAVRNEFFKRVVKHGLQIVYRCNEHYTLIGSATQECNNGQWTYARPSCKGICGRPIVPLRGPLILHGNSFLDGDEVQFSCVANYDLFGSQRSRCVGQKWNTRIPECKARCTFGGDPDNGFAVRNAFFKRMVKHGLQIVYRCNEHYTLIGSATQGCNNGQWTNAKPSCKGTCDRPIIPPRGPLILLGNSFLDGDEVQFSCVANYDLFGSQRSRCNGQKWNTSIPECKARCIFRGDPDNGFAVRNAFFKGMVKHGVQILYRCFIHYTLIGSATQECNNGRWTNARPSCKGTCGRPIVPFRGPLILHGNSFLDGDEVQFTCAASYDLFGSQRSRCVGQKWNTGIPECKARCIFGGDPDNGFAVRNAIFNRVVRHGLQIVYRCNEHYTLIGSATQECNNGQWTNTRPSCKASCRRPEPPRNGRMRGDNFNHNEKVVFYCDENYQLVGQSQITCKDGSWSDLLPKCIVVNCGPLQRPDHGNIIEIVGTTFGNRIVFECTEKGYEIRGSKVRTCQSDGSWSGLPTTCELVKCDDPGTPVNGMRIVSKGLVYGGSLRFKCNRDYTLMKGMSEIIYCQANKRWTASVPHCVAPCRDPGVPRQGNRIGDDVRHDSKVTFSCPNGYLMEGVGEISCSNGTWSNRVPTCKAPCVKLSRPANGYMRGDFRHGNQVRFVCYYGYQMIGAASSTCNDGTWSNSAPICKGICGRPRVSSRGPLNLHGNSFLDGDEVQFSCIANYDLFGSQRSRCVGRRWNTGIPECKARCIFGGDPKNGFAVRNAFFNRMVKHGLQIVYRCNNHYTLTGSATQDCNNGQWTNSRPSCKASCQWPGRIDNGRKIGHSYKHGHTVQYVCNRGYILVGKQDLTCADGVWSSHRPACRASCRLPEPPTNGGIRGDNFNHNEKVVFYCDENYQLVGESEITCKDGSWSDLYPTCVATCPNPGEPAHGRRLSNDFQDDRTVAFACDDGFDLFGNKAILCSGGSWNASIPECKASCDHPGDIAHGQLTSQYFSHGQLVRYKCDLGYSLEGNHELTCNNGDWNSNPPNCKACQNPIGMENPSIRNFRITSADYLSSPNFARLNGRLAWCTTKQTYLQVNLGKRRQVTAIATQGGQDNTGIIRWVRKYKLSFFAGPRKEIFYQESGTQQVIDGNQNATSTITYFFKEPFITQVVRIYPNFRSTPVCLRMELYGCDPNPDCIHVGSAVWGLWEREGDSLSYYLVYITQLNATHVDFVLDYYPDKFLTRSYNRSEPVLVVDKTPKMTDISVGSRVIGVHRRKNKEWYKNGVVTRTSRYYAQVRFKSGTVRWVPLEELRLEKRPRFCTTGA